MRKNTILALFSALVLLAAEGFSGTWQFSVDLDGGGHGDPTFVLEQKGDKLAGTYSGPLGEHKVSGTVKGKTAVFGIEVTGDAGQLKVTYSGELEGDTRMKGTVQFTGAVETSGKWTAVKK